MALREGNKQEQIVLIIRIARVTATKELRLQTALSLVAYKTIGVCIRRLGAMKIGSPILSGCWQIAPLVS